MQPSAGKWGLQLQLSGKGHMWLKALAKRLWDGCLIWSV